MIRHGRNQGPRLSLGQRGELRGTTSSAASRRALSRTPEAASSIPTSGYGCLRRAGRAVFIFACGGSRALSYVGVEGYDDREAIQTKGLRHATRLFRRKLPDTAAKAMLFLEIQFATSPANIRFAVDDQAVGRLENSLHEGDGDVEDFVER